MRHAPRTIVAAPATRRGRHPVASAALNLAVATVFALASPAFGAGHSLRFFGTGAGDVDRVKIRVDDPVTTLPGPAIDVGGADFTLEFWLKGAPGGNAAAAVTCGANAAWVNGNVVVDRDRYNQDRKFGVSIAGGRMVFGVSGAGTGDRTLCGTTSVLDGAWHHVAVQRRRSDGFLWLYVDGSLEASGDGPDGDVSYPDDGVPGNFCGGPCTGSDPFLVLGAEKHDAGPAYPSFSGWLDEFRVSTRLRYATAFSRPRAPFVVDRHTVALYHFDDGNGTSLYDETRGADGLIRRGGGANGPAWSPDSPFSVGGLAAGAPFRLTPHVGGLSSPIDIASANDGSGRLYVVEQAGRIRIVRNGVLNATPFLDITGKTAASGERGLLGVAFHPNYRTNGLLFVYYTRSADGALVIERYQRSTGNVERVAQAPATVQTLLTIPHASASNHNGGKLAFGRDGYLYIGTGDGGGGNDPDQNGQNLGTRLGKMLRIDVDAPPLPGLAYAVPASNPYAGQTCNGAGVGTCPEIWAYGLRNPWRFSFDRATGALFIGDVGQGAREEVDFEPAGAAGGRNYGWRIMEGTICTPGVNPGCTPPANHTPPVLEYSHDATGGVSITGGFRYRGSRVPGLAGAYLYGDFGSSRMWAATVDDAGAWTATFIRTAPTGMSAFGEDESGELYVAGYGNGTVYRIDPNDTDGDGLPDWWESAYFGLVDAAPGADADGDGANNLSEYLGRTDPLTTQSAPPPFIVPPTVAIFRPSQARFHVDTDRDGVADLKLYMGGAADVPLAGRIDVDGRNDPVVYRNGVWYADTNRDGVADVTIGFGGVPGDRPLLADLNGDGRDDLVVFRGGAWFVSTGQDGAANLVLGFGAPADVPLAGDINGDGVADLAVYRNGVWYLDTNRDGTADQVVAFGGGAGDVPLLFDYDGDGRADLVIVRAGTWYVSTQRNGIAQFVFGYGAATDVPLGWRDR